MLSRNMISTVVVGAAAVLALTACGPSSTSAGGPSSPSPSPTFSTIPATTPAPMHPDPTAVLTVPDMSAALSAAGVQWSARDVIGMGELTIADYRARDTACKASGDYFRDCGSRDAQRRTLPSRCIAEAERTDTAPDVGACGIALEYVEKVMGK